MTLDEFLPTVRWWQRWEIAPGVFTPGPNDVAAILDKCGFPQRIDGARVLDIGGWNGCFAFECERRGASEVVMLEPNPDTGFELTKAFLGSKVIKRSGTVYDLDPAVLGRFDIVLFLGVVYHLRYPLLGFDNIRRVAKDWLYTESACLEEATRTFQGWQGFATFAPEMANLPMLQFWKGSEYFEDSTNWFIPNQAALDGMIEAAGFQVDHVLINRRYFSRARMMEGRAPMFSQAHEGIDYDVHLAHLLGPLDSWQTREDG